MNNCMATLGLVATLSLVGCTQASEITFLKPTTPARTTASPSQETNLPSSSADVATQNQKSAATSGEPVQLHTQEAENRIDVRSEPSKQAKSVYSGQVGDKGRAFDMTRDSTG